MEFLFSILTLSFCDIPVFFTQLSYYSVIQTAEKLLNKCIDHITSGCQTLAPKEYTLHNKVNGIIKKM